MICAVLMVFPVFWTILCSFLTEEMIEKLFGTAQSAVSISEIITNISLQQYKVVLLLSPDYLIRFWNSCLLVIPIVLFQLVTAGAAAYGFLRLRGKAAVMLFFGYVVIMMMPYQVTVIPNYMAVKGMGLLNTNWAIWLPGIFSPFSVYLLTKYMKRIPESLFEAAQIDGAGEWKMFLKVAVPLCKGELTACAMLIFIDSWNMVELPLVMFSGMLSYPLSVYLSRIREGALGISFAAAVVYLIPVILVFLYGEEDLTRNIASGTGIKG